MGAGSAVSHWIRLVDPYSPAPLKADQSSNLIRRIGIQAFQPPPVAPSKNDPFLVAIIVPLLCVLVLGPVVTVLLLRFFKYGKPGNRAYSLATLCGRWPLPQAPPSTADFQLLSTAYDSESSKLLA